MSTLSSTACQACRVDAEKVSEQQIDELSQQIPDWSIQTVDEVLQLTRVFKFKTFRLALEFTNRVGELAESEGHHPAILTEWGKVTVCWWTHKIKGLHLNDFICSAKTDNLS